MKIHHIGYLVSDTERTARAFAAMAPVRHVDRKPLDAQGVYISLLGTEAGGPYIELVEPYPSNTAMRRRLVSCIDGASPYHICYSVKDFDATLRSMLADGWLMVTRPFKGIDERLRASHLFKQAVGMVEIIEEAAS
jgi:methylmalonyl-CoA/ethylmalonyl-CoA epimerase